MDYIFRWLEIRFVTGRQYPLFKEMIVPPQLGGAQPPSAAGAGENGGAQPPSAVGMGHTSAPAGGLAPEAGRQEPETGSYTSIIDRGLYHAADAMKELVDMGDAPSCYLCGAIMTRNGSCYRCMSCGSTSGCS